MLQANNVLTHLLVVRTQTKRLEDKRILPNARIIECQSVLQRQRTSPSSLSELSACQFVYSAQRILFWNLRFPNPWGWNSIDKEQLVRELLILSDGWPETCVEAMDFLHVVSCDIYIYIKIYTLTYVKKYPRTRHRVEWEFHIDTC